MCKKAVIVMLSLVLTLVLVVSSCTTTNPPPTPPPTPTPTDQSALPEHRPLIPPRIVGAATLEPFGTDIRKNGVGANRAFSEYFNFNEIKEDRYSQELIVDILLCSDTLNHFEQREPGHILFELQPNEGHGLWEFSPKNILYENAQTLQADKITYSTEVIGKLRSRGDFYKFRIEITNFDTRRHNVSWEIYVWE